MEDSFIDDVKKYTDIAEKRSDDFEEVNRALEWIGNFIRENKYILYGGMAIDLSLKFKNNEGIYTSDMLPDYDFMCPDFYNISIYIADELHKLGFNKVNAINALHLTSRRVRINNVAVADITYVPKNIMETIPTITTASGFRVVHPDYQRIDMLRSFCTIFCFPPMETLNHRTKKDIIRYRLLSNFYDIPRFKNKTKAPSLKKLPEFNREKMILGGEVIYHILYGLMPKILHLNKKNNIVREAITTREVPGISLDYLLDKFNKLDALKVPNDPREFAVHNWSLWTDDIMEVVRDKKYKDKKYYNRYMDDLAFRYIKSGDVEIFDSWGTGVLYFDLEKSYGALGFECPESLKNLRIVQPSMAMQYMLQRSFIKPEMSEYYRTLYSNMYDLLEISDILCQNNLVDENILFDYPFVFSLRNSFGHRLISNEHRYSNCQFWGTLGKTQRPPFNYNADTDEKQEFVISPENTIFNLDGEETDEFQEKQTNNMVI
mgnify:CR=1 FL=1